MVKLGDIPPAEDQIVGGFSDVSGLGNEVKYAEYRNGNDKANHVRKIAEREHHRRRHPQAGRGRRPRLVQLDQGDSGRDRHEPRDSDDHAARRGPSAGLQLGAEERPAQEVVGPTLAAKGGGEVAMEELHFVAEQIDFVSS